jgi:hypothetical protein
VLTTSLLSMCRYELDLLAVLRLTTPCYSVASVLPRAVVPERTQTSSAAAKEAPAVPCMTVSVMPLMLLACGGKILLYECVADPEQLKVGAKFSTAVKAFETAAEHAEEHVSQVMHGIVSAARRHVAAQEREHAEAANGAANWFCCSTLSL